ncbi:helix-turn-helix domain-containing protein [Gordonia sp. CPCC 206044]|uniref:TetR/AcrR family transcriptional regulator n=1 Tax=Gordonia sp. CPCC 206044 TaxID=3140793 RepID=UPI003AF35E09
MSQTSHVSTDVEWTPKAREILSAASELFYAQGIHAVGVEAIAARAGVTKRTLYDRFGSKDRLVVEYLHARDVTWREYLTDHLTGVPDDPRARLAAVFDATREWAAERNPKGCSMINAYAEISDPDHPAYPIIVGQKRWMLELFAGIAADAVARNPRQLGERLLMVHDGALVTAGMGVVPDAYEQARAMALMLLDAG